jgi:glycosyltransferase involved in cell wall biosynthesis
MPKHASGVDGPTNVLIVTTGLGIGGAEIVVRDLAIGIDRGRFRVTVCCLSVLGLVGEDLTREGVDIVVLGQGHHPKADYLSFLKLRRLMQQRQIAVLHSHTTYALVDSCLARRTTRGVKLVHTFHFGNYPHKDRQGLLMEGLAARFADRLIAVGDVQRVQIRDVYRLADDRIRTVRNGVRPPAPSVEGGFRAQIGVGDALLVGTLANLIEQKGLVDLLAVASSFRDARPRVRFVVVGEGVLRPELERRRRELGLDEVVVFAGWLKNAADVALPSFDIYFQPSLWEAMSIALLEAMRAGKPVVATAVGEAPHMIEEGREGFLAAPGDIDAMATAIALLAADAGLRKRMGLTAALRAESEFSVGNMVRAYEAIYLDLAGRRNGS